MPASTGPIVRQDERLKCDVPASVAVDPACADDVPLARGGSPARIIDAGPGGLAIEWNTFLPRECRIRLLATPRENAAPIELRLRVQRVTMAGRAPTYLMALVPDEERPGSNTDLGAFVQRLGEPTTGRPSRA